MCDGSHLPADQSGAIRSLGDASKSRSTTSLGSTVSRPGTAWCAADSTKRTQADAKARTPRMRPGYCPPGITALHILNELLNEHRHSAEPRYHDARAPYGIVRREIRR